MTIQLSTAVRNARLDSIETTIGTAAIIKIRTGAQPANCAAADTGTVLISWTLAADWMGAAAGGSKSLLNTPVSVAASATGTAAHYRVYDSTGTTCHMQGTIGTSGTDLIIDNTSVNSGQTCNITSGTLTDGNP